MKRVFLVVLDSFGIGEMPDAATFGDAGANTLASCAATPHFSLPNMTALGLGNITGVSALAPVAAPQGAFGRMAEASRGKDTTVGHWELAGLISERPLPTFPNGFPEELLAEFSRAVGRGVLCNRPYSGTAVIADYGEEHLASGDLIVYTSADSVFQIAAHEDLVPPEMLYEYCRIARRLLTGPYAVGRVIARPFVGTAGNFIRTDRRRDFSVEPPAKTLTDAVREAGLSVIAVGKIADIFAGRGITEHIPTHSNPEGEEAFLSLVDRDFRGLAFINLVDFDMLYGHRRDAVGYAGALMHFDRTLGRALTRLREGDLLVITADHGCDPGYTKTTDHTREYVPLLVAGKGVTPTSLGTRPTFADLGATVAEALGLAFRGAGQSFFGEWIK